MIKLLLILCLACSLQAFSQNDTINYINYHRRFALIEELIVNEEFVRAEDSIAKLFSEYDPPFMREISIALQIAALNKSYDYTAELIELAFKKGAEWHCMEQKPVLKEFKQTKKWAELSANYPNYRKIYFQSIDSVLRDDFRARHECEEASKGTDSILYVVERNYDHIVKIMHIKGHFPGEKMIGVQEKGDYSSWTCSYDNSKVITTLLHYQLSFSSLEKELERALREGYLHPFDFAFIFEFQKKFAEKKNYNRIIKRLNFKKPILTDYDFSIVDPQCKDLKRVNADRYKIGLCTYEVEKKKTAIDKKYNIEFDYIF